MTERVKWRAIWGLLGVAATLVLIIYIAGHYEKELERINWALVSLLSLLVFGAIAVYRWNDQLADYNVIQLFLNPVTKQPDPYRHLMWAFAGLTFWAIVQVVLEKQWAILTTLLLGALGFFVAKPAIDGLSDAIGRRPVSQDQPANLNINAPNADTVNTQGVQPVSTQPTLPSAIRTIQT